MSVKDIRSDRRLTPRVLRIRNRCLANLATHHALPLPSEQDVAAFDDTVGLSDSWRRWEETHTPPKDASGIIPGQAARRAGRGRVRRMVAGAVVVAAFAAGFVSFTFYNTVRDRQRAAALAPANDGWVPVTDSAIATLRGKLVGFGTTKVSLRITLTTGDVGALIAGGLEPRPRIPLDSLTVRIDTLVWLRGRVRGASRFELAARLHPLGSSRAELQIVRLAIDGVERPTSSASRVMIGWSFGRGDRMQFTVPAFVGDLRLDNRVVQFVTRGQWRGVGQRRTRSP